MSDASPSASPSLPDGLDGRWRLAMVLKQDVFSTIERGRYVTPQGERDAVLRRLDETPWWSRPLAIVLFRRESRALEAASPLGVAPPLLFTGRRALVRGFIEGVALHIAKPTGDAFYFRSAKAALRKLHRAGICHNDLAKEQNWLRGTDGRAYLTDFQLAAVFRTRTKMFRVAAYEDLRHLLKHKRKYAPETLTAMERRVLAKKSVATRIWMATGKRVYRLVTRGVFNFVDREGGGTRLVHDAPEIAANLKKNPAVQDAVIVAFPDRATGTGLYAFVQTRDALSPAALRQAVDTASGALKSPERLQAVDALPRNPQGAVRAEILTLVAMNQFDMIDGLIADETERAIVDRIIAGRQNLRDRFSF